MFPVKSETTKTSLPQSLALQPRQVLCLAAGRFPGDYYLMYVNCLLQKPVFVTVFYLIIAIQKDPMLANMAVIASHTTFVIILLP